MGMVYDYKCPQCGYSFHLVEGFGRKRPPTYDGSMKPAQTGEWGKAFQKFTQKHPDTPNNALKMTRVTTRCKECGALDTDETWSVSDGKRRVYKNYPRKCEKCGGEVRVLHWNQFKKCLVCPKCKISLKENKETRIFVD